MPTRGLLDGFCICQGCASLHVSLPVTGMIICTNPLQLLVALSLFA